MKKEITLAELKLGFDEIERDYILNILRRENWNLTNSAVACGTSPPNLIYRISRDRTLCAEYNRHKHRRGRPRKK